jgi:hypothetical protein
MEEIETKDDIIWKEALFNRKMYLLFNSVFVIDLNEYKNCNFYKKNILILYYNFLYYKNKKKRKKKKKKK